MNAQDKISKAVVQIALKYPFWATFLYTMPRVPTRHPKIDTACTDGKTVYYNPDFIDTLTLSETEGLLVHEMGHVFLGHPWRMKGKHNATANKAGDYVINDMMKKANIPLPPNPLHDEAFSGKATEEVYKIIYVEPEEESEGGGGGGSGGGDSPGEGQGDGSPNPDDSGDGDGDGDGPNTDNYGGDPGGSGGFMEPLNEDGSQLSDSQREEALNEVKIKARQAAEAAKKVGKLPGDLEELIEDYLHPESDWLEVLSRFTGAVARNDFSMAHPNRRFAAGDIYMPSLHSETFGRVIFAVDNSGSVSEQEVRQMFSEIMGALECYDDDPELTVVQCDTRVNGVDRYRAGDEVKVRGGGGTSYAPVMDWLRQNMYTEDEPPVACIYHTDGYCNDFGEDPGIPVLWALSGDHVPARQFEQKIPFGEVVVVPPATNNQ